MSVQTKKRFKNLGKIIGVALFALLMFTNIKIALMDDAELASGDISIMGIDVSLFVPTYAEDTSTGGTWVDGKLYVANGKIYVVCPHTAATAKCYLL